MLRRHEARRLDYMRYVEYELNLESLRALRTRRVEGGAGAGGNQQRNKKKKTKKGKAATADFCCVRLVRWIFDRAVMKFPGDVDIWLHYIDFAARQGQSKVRGGVVAALTSERRGSEETTELLFVSKYFLHRLRFPSGALSRTGVSTGVGQREGGGAEEMSQTCFCQDQ